MRFKTENWFYDAKYSCLFAFAMLVFLLYPHSPFPYIYYCWPHILSAQENMFITPFNFDSNFAKTTWICFFFTRSVLFAAINNDLLIKRLTFR